MREKILALIGLCVGVSAAIAADDRPNIVVILSDDAGWNSSGGTPFQRAAK